MKKEKKKKHRVLRLTVSLIGLALMIFIAVFLIVNRDKLTWESIKGIFRRSGDEQAMQLQLETDSSASYTTAGSSLAIAFESGIRLYDKSGEILLADSAGLDNPAICASSKWAAAYGIGSRELTVFSASGEKTKITADNSVTSVSMSEGGMAVIAKEQGYKGSVTVYDNKMEPVYKWYSGSAYITGAAVSPGGNRLAVLTVSTNGSHLNMFSLDSETVQGTYTDDNTLALDAAFLSDGRAAVLSESSLRFFSASAELEKEFDFEGMQLMDYSFGGDGFAVVALAENRWSDRVKIIQFSPDGSVKKQLELEGEFRSLSASGGYISVLMTDRLDIYRSGLSLSASWQVQGAHKVLQRRDGAAIAVYDYLAEVYAP